MSVNPTNFNSINYDTRYTHARFESQQEPSLSFQGGGIPNESVCELELNNNLSNENEDIKNLFNTTDLEELAKEIDRFNPYNFECETDISLNLNFFQSKELGSFDETSTDSRQVPEQNPSIDDTDRPRASKKRKREPSIQGESDTPNSKSKLQEYILERKGILAKGQLLTDDSMLVKKGSTACMETVPSIARGYLKLRKELLNKKILVPDSGNKKYIFTNDYTFGNWTIAASVISGVCVSGSKFWKNSSIQSIKAIKLKRKNS